MPTPTNPPQQTESSSAQTLFGRAIDDIKAKKNTVEERIGQLRKAGESASKELRAGVEMAWDDLKLSLESALNQFSRTDEKKDDVH